MGGHEALRRASCRGSRNGPAAGKVIIRMRPAEGGRREGKGTRKGKEGNTDNGKEARENSPNWFLQACSEGGAGTDPEPARHVMKTLRFEARTLCTASACHAFNVEVERLCASHCVTVEPPYMCKCMCLKDSKPFSIDSENDLYFM